MTKPALTVHINTARKRKKLEQSRNMVEAAKVIASEKQVEGYAIVAWSKDFSHTVAYSGGGTMPSLVIPEYVKGALTRRIHATLSGGE